MIYRLRMRLARLVAPTTIMPDPFPGAEAVVIYRQDDFQVAIRLSEMRMRMSTRLPSFDEVEAAAPYEYVPSKTLVRLVGTVAR